MNTAKIYTDSNGNKRTIHQMVNYNPHWAASRIRVGESALERLSIAQQAFIDIIGLAKAGRMINVEIRAKEALAKSRGPK